MLRRPSSVVQQLALSLACVKFNRYWLNPTDPESLPPGLLDALQDMWTPADYPQERGDPIELRLRSQMRADALQPLSAEAGNHPSIIPVTGYWAEETLKDVTVFLRMNVRLVS
jgi:hypothetical protein